MQIVILILNNKYVIKDLNPDMDHKKPRSIDTEPLEKLGPPKCYTKMKVT